MTQPLSTYLISSLSTHCHLHQAPSLEHWAGSAMVTSQLCIQCHQVDGLKSASVEVFATPKFTNATGPVACFWRVLVKLLLQIANAS